MSIEPSTALLELGSDFWDLVTPASFPRAELRFVNRPLLDATGLVLSNDELQRHFWAFEPFPKNLPRPLALRYHGHQFLSYNPDLGDGRGFSFAQFLVDGELFECGTKGSGTTPYSRRGDGRLTLKGAVREALATEMLETLGVRTSRTVCFFETGESLVRGDEPSPTRSAVLTRWSRGHVRIGSFQRTMAENKPGNTLRLRDYALQHLFRADGIDPARATADFFARTVAACAEQVASFMAAGFVHGVLNTDNINVTGESFDYGPYRFLPTYDPSFTAAYFDHQGLYCFGRQPVTFLWNLDQLGRCLAFADPSFDPAPRLQRFGDLFNEGLARQTLRRLNLKSRGPDADASMATALFSFLEDSGASFAQTWFDLHSGAEESRLRRSPQSAVYGTPEFMRLRDALEDFEIADERRRSHPFRERPRPSTLLIDEIEALWAPISANDDWSLFEGKIEEIRAMRGL